ncbi:MMPL family transporter [Streptomyces sp. NPDC020875]|uniref:MMPL family transporter n=1 Tax=Streptomyces sp. NPDC020875 TaxID=3154898 RepID=UPI0033E75347
MIRSITSFATRRRWLTIGVWVLLGIALSVVGQSLMYKATDSQTGDFLPKGYDSAAALRIAEEEFGAKPDANAATVLLSRTDGKKLTAADRARIADIVRELADRRIEAAKPEMPLMEDHSQKPRLGIGTVAPDGTFQLVSLSLKGNMNDPGLQEVYKDFRDDARKEFTGAGMKAGFTGGIASSVDSIEASKESEQLVHIATIGLIVLLNVLVFRSPLAALLPLIACVLVGGVASGAVAGFAELFDISLDASVPSLITVVLLGIGIDYFLFLLFRFREELRNNPGVNAREAAATTAAKVGGAVTSAGLTIVAAFATLGVASFGQFRVLGPAIAVSVLVMLLASLTLMPAILAVTGRAMFWPSKAWQRERRGGFAARLGLAVAHRPVRYVLGSLALLGLLSAGALGVKMSYDMPEQDRTDAVQVAEEIARSMPAGAVDPHTVYVRGDKPLDERAVNGLGDALRKTEGVAQVLPARYDADRDAASIGVVLKVGSESSKARELVSGPVRAAIAEHRPDGADAHITGTAAIYADVSEAVEKDLRLVFPIAAGLIALILLLLLRSLVAPLVLLVAVGLGFAATLGAATLLFQHMLDRPGVLFTLPLVLFLFVVALGTDYNILIGDRIREEMAKPVPARRAVAEAVRHTAPAIATAGLVLAGSFGSLAASPATQEVGFSTALGILLSALVLSLVLVPALAALLGRSMWWPSRGDRHQQQHDQRDGSEYPQHQGHPEPSYATGYGTEYGAGYAPERHPAGPSGPVGGTPRR